MANDVVETLIAARNLVETGWCQCTFSQMTPDGVWRYCPLGAIAKVRPPVGEVSWENQHAIDPPSVAMISWAMTRVFGYGPPTGMKDADSVGYWNDLSSTTKDQIIRAFDLAITLAGREPQVAV